MNVDPRSKLSEQVHLARIYVLEHALLGWVEDVLGRVPSDDEIIDNGQHFQFVPGALTTFHKDGHAFANFYVWDGRHVLAYGFDDPKDPTALSVVRLPENPWPPALCAAVEKWTDARNKEKGTT